jgi:hypothetical protein
VIASRWRLVYLRRVSIGDVLREAWELYKKFLWQLFLTAFVVFVVLDLVAALANAAAGDGVAAGLLWGLIATALAIIGYFWVEGALVELVRDVRDGRADRGIGETFQSVQPRVPALIIAGLLAGIGIFIGLLLLIVPGLYLLTIWSMIVPVIVFEGRRAGESFTRSREIVRGRGWSVFGLIVVVFLIIAIASAIIRLVFAPLPEFLETWLGSLIAHSLTVPFAAAALAVAYFHLTERQPESQPALESAP